MTISQFPVVPVEDESKFGISSWYNLDDGQLFDLDAGTNWRSSVLKLGWAAAEKTPVNADDHAGFEEYTANAATGRAASPPRVKSRDCPVIGLAFQLAIKNGDDDFTLNFWNVPEGDVTTGLLANIIGNEGYTKLLVNSGPITPYFFTGILWAEQIQSGGYFELVEVGTQVGVTLTMFRIKRLRYAKPTQPA